jgi:hypothetical protein
MSPKVLDGRVVSAVAPSLALLVLATVAAPGEPESDGTTARLTRRDERFAVARAIHGATRQLEDAGCQALLDEFRDADGRPLRAAVEAQGLVPEQYLGRVFFYDAPAAACSTSNLAMTVPGNRAVFVCGGRFVRQMKRDSASAEAIIIHEWLHTLGLGENPPSSDEITARVRARCGQARKLAGTRPETHR